MDVVLVEVLDIDDVALVIRFVAVEFIPERVPQNDLRAKRRLPVPFPACSIRSCTNGRFTAMHSGFAFGFK